MLFRRFLSSSGRWDNKLDEYKSIDALAATMTKNFCIDLIRKQKHNYTRDFTINDYQGLASPSPHEADGKQGIR